MPATLKGKATVEGISGTVTYPAIVANGALEALTADVTDQADIQQRLDGNGFVRGYRLRNQRKEFNVTLLMTVASGNARADATKAAIFPPNPSKVVLAAFEEGSGAGINGDYVYEGGGQISYGDDYNRMTLPLRKYDHETADNLTAAVT